LIAKFADIDVLEVLERSFPFKMSGIDSETASPLPVPLPRNPMR
jgi:hypothetical protein